MPLPATANRRGTSREPPCPIEPSLTPRPNCCSGTGLEWPVVTSQLLRLAAYGVCIVDERMLLARYVSPDGRQRHWTLPGGKVEHAEDPYDAVVREVAEETGYVIGIDRLLGV